MVGLRLPNEAQPSVNKELVFAESLSLNIRRNLKQDCADFYLLERIVYDDRAAARPMSVLTSSLSREMSIYLDMAVGGELRYVRRSDNKGLDVPSSLTPFFAALEKTSGSRRQAWIAWTDLRRKYDPESVEWLVDAKRLFDDKEWKIEGAGGPAWGSVARVEYDWLKGRLTRQTFIDRCFTIEHNNGAVFDKVYETHGLNKVLELQASDAYNRLAKYASPYVQTLWRQRNRRTRQDYDPAWIGIQDEES